MEDLTNQVPELETKLFVIIHSITPIQFDITPGAVSLISNASNPSWLSLVLSGDKSTVTVSTVDALKNIGVDYQTSFPYSFTL